MPLLAQRRTARRPAGHRGRRRRRSPAGLRPRPRWSRSATPLSIPGPGSPTRSCPARRVSPCRSASSRIGLLQPGEGRRRIGQRPGVHADRPALVLDPRLGQTQRGQQSGQLRQHRVDLRRLGRHQILVAVGVPALHPVLAQHRHRPEPGDVGRTGPGARPCRVGRPVITTTLATRAASRPSAITAAGSAYACSGSSTIGARVPSKSRPTRVSLGLLDDRLQRSGARRRTRLGQAHVAEPVRPARAGHGRSG